MKFTIRDLLRLTLLAAVVVASWVDHRRQNERFDRFVNALMFRGDRTDHP